MPADFRFDRELAYRVRIVRVKDGDSLVVRIEDDDLPEARGHALEVRLAGIDAPELSQPLGRESKRTLQRLLRQRVGLVVLGTDRYERLLGVLLFEQPQGMRADDSVNRAMVRLGMAFWYRQFASYETIGLEAAEREARRAAVGVWAERGGSERPWDHRRTDRTQATKAGSGCASVLAALAAAALAAALIAAV